jgi:hypothetical protein
MRVQILRGLGLRALATGLLSGVLAVTPGHAQQSPAAATTAQPSTVQGAMNAAFEETLRKPGDPATLVKYAALAVKAGNIEGAISALERLLLIEGDQPRVKLELGVLYFRLGSYEAARGYLESAKASPRATNKIRKEADEFLADIERKTGRSHLSGELLAGIGYSTNANSGPSGAIQSFGANSVPTPNVSGQADFNAVVAASFSHRYDLGRQDNGTFESDMLLYGSRQFQVTSANVAIADLTLGPRTHPFDGWAEPVSLKPFLTGRYASVDDMTNYWAWGAGVEAASKISSNASTTFTLLARRREFVNNSDAPQNNQSSGNEAGLTWEFDFDLGDAWSASFIANYTRYLAQTISENYTEVGVGGSVSYRFKDPIGLNGRNWLATVSAGVQRASYDQADPSVNPSERRAAGGCAHRAARRAVELRRPGDLNQPFGRPQQLCLRGLLRSGRDNVALLAGVSMRRVTVGAAFAVLLLCSPAEARVGVTSATAGDPLGQAPAEQERILRVGIDVQLGERVTTRDADRAHLVFLDGTSLAIGPNSAVIVDTFVYDPNGRKGELNLTVAKGVLRLVGGGISKTGEIAVATPSASIGIRGGILTIEVRPAGTTATFLYGQSMTVKSQGQTQTATRIGSSIHVDLGFAPQPAIVLATRTEIPGLTIEKPDMPDSAATGAQAQIDDALDGSDLERAAREHKDGRDDKESLRSATSKAHHFSRISNIAHKTVATHTAKKTTGAGSGGSTGHDRR